MKQNRSAIVVTVLAVVTILVLIYNWEEARRAYAHLPEDSDAPNRTSQIGTLLDSGY